MFNAHYIMTVWVVLSVTSLSNGGIIRRDVSIVTETASSEAMNQRPTSLPGPHDNHLNEIPQGDEVEESSEVNNNLGAIPSQEEESLYGRDGQRYSSGLADIHPNGVGGAAVPTTVVDYTLSPSTNQTVMSTVDPTVTLPSTTLATTSQIHLTNVAPAPQHSTTQGDNATVTTPQEGALPTENTTVAIEHQPDPCLEPTNHQLRMHFKQNNQHMKFPAIAILPKETSTESLGVGGRSATGEEPRVVTSASDEYVNITCPSELLHVRGLEALNRRSLCPWIYVANVDQDRYPSTIQVAKCRCPQCIDTTLPNEGAFSHDNICTPVNFKIKVLRRGPCVNGMYMYYSVYEEIPVACACVRRKVV